MARAPFGAVAGFAKQIYRAGASRAAEVILENLEEMGADALIALAGGPSTPLGALLQGFIEYNGRISQAYEREANKPMSKAQKRAYQKQHAEWLRDNRWRFDWRSQPRQPKGIPEGGEWMEGRLDYMAEQKKAYSRSERQQATRSMRAYKARQRAAGNMKTRTIYSKWGEF